MFDLAVIGAGPSGMAAAAIACEQGMRVVIVDNQDRAGGQILRRPPAEFSVRKWLPQRVYRYLHTSYAKFASLENLTHRNNTQVLGITPGNGEFSLHLVAASGLECVFASRVLIATGCFDMPLAFPGAQLPGVMSAGGLQAFFKSQQIIPGERFLFAGSHPLQLIVANQIAGAGGNVAAVVFTRRLSDYLKVLRRPGVLLRQLPNMLFFIGVALQLFARRVPIRFGVELVRAEGDSKLERVQLTAGREKGNSESIDCDRLGLCFGFLTNNDLARQAGVSCRWSQTSGGWAAGHDDGMRASIAGVYVAGETTGVGGAKVASLEGRLAALTAAFDAGKLQQPAYASACAALRAPLKAARQFGELLAQVSYPGDEFITHTMAPEALLCKCEEVTVASTIATLNENPDVCDLSALKLLTRCGMGHCQGRYCHFQSRFLLARERGVAPQSVGGFVARFPCVPVSISELVGEQSVAEVRS